MEYGWEEIVVDTFVFTVVDAFIAIVGDAFVFTGLDVFVEPVADAIVVITVVGARVGGVSAGAVVSTGAGSCVVFWVGRVVMGV
jgi:hypothetical protein